MEGKEERKVVKEEGLRKDRKKGRRNSRRGGKERMTRERKGGRNGTEEAR